MPSNPGANRAFLTEDFAAVESFGSGVGPDLVVYLLDFQVATFEWMLDVANTSNADAVLKVASADHILLEKYQCITHLIVNESEVGTRSGLGVKELKASTIESWTAFTEKSLEELAWKPRPRSWRSRCGMCEQR